MGRPHGRRVQPGRHVHRQWRRGGYLGIADSYRYVETGMVGDGEIVARVTSEQADNPFAKAGLLITRPDTNATVILDIRPNGVIESMARATQGGPMAFIAGSATSFPVWLK